MKIAIECKSPLLQKSLELFLYDYLSSSKSCDIFIKDQRCLEDKRTFFISSDSDADLVKPFSREVLILALEKRYFSSHKEIITVPDREKKIEKEKPKPKTRVKEPLYTEIVEEVQENHFELLEKRIELLTQDYQKNIINTIKAFYEK